MHVAHYLGLLHRAEANLADAYRQVGAAHAEEADVHHLTGRLAAQCDQHVERLAPFVERYAQEAPQEPERLHAELFAGARGGGLGVLRDLHDLYLMASYADITWTVLGQAAAGLRDDDLATAVAECEQDTSIQLSWLRTRMKAAAPQALVVA
ncbi:hypothetical protein Ais01nite_72770 [Asanoa ishikariensis]|uniref:Ferritin-like metal-binding protein YciE n=1 Tax=Asanoa ishikariensis TaxID=137265 RepID=A0A1H3UQS6_9ACTN|nr:hypothetical protein [Asanoa ishikariensis]GIF69242.1 hypothetical protein Ais01nite_72770 [Asanoa ishikariensis]SDZ64688.1 hypothetical protein SAMN05421684_7811 [Asanoa ishikariensis]